MREKNNGDSTVLYGGSLLLYAIYTHTLSIYITGGGRRCEEDVAGVEVEEEVSDYTLI